MGEELGSKLFFFSDFMKKGFFTERNLRVVDAAFGMSHIIVLCYDALMGKYRVFGCGSSKYG